jgi:hypothetical protein
VRTTRNAELISKAARADSNATERTVDSKTPAEGQRGGKGLDNIVFIENMRSEVRGVLLVQCCCERCVEC